MIEESSKSRWWKLVWAVALGVATVAPAGAQDEAVAGGGNITVGRSVRNDVSPPLRDIPVPPVVLQPLHVMIEPGGEPRQAWRLHDPVVQDFLAPDAMPAPILNFDGVPFPGVACNCAPPDTDGEVGATQYLQMVNQAIQVFDKVTGASLLGPIDIQTIWSGFGGLCQTNGFGDPIVVYDQLANRWLVSQFAGTSVPTDECVAVSTTSDATGSWNRYDFHLGTNFFDYPKIGVWPDGYYMLMNVFNSSGTAYLGPQPFALDRAAMLAGTAATFITPGLQSAGLGTILPADLDGPIPPPAGAPNPWLSTNLPNWRLYRFHVDWGTPANSTFTLGGNLTPSGYSTLGVGVPQLGTADRLATMADRPMFRLAYRRFADSHEALVGNLTVSSNSVAGIRWFEIDNATSGAPSFTQEGTYQPDTTWRWMGSTAMDTEGNLAVGFSASSASIHPEIRYAGRLAGDTPGVLAQGEATLFAGAGSQTDTQNRWGDYSDITVDPVDDCTFWYTTEYYQTTSSFNWRTRIGNFKFPGCLLTPDFTIAATPASQSICAGTSALYTVDVGAVSGFANNVTLSASGNPGATTTGFVPNPVTPPGTSTLTVGNTSGVGAGTYSIAVAGSASGSPGHSTPVDLTVFATAPAAPTLTAPANGATGVDLTPTFTWTGGAGSVDYTIEVASDAGFGTIVASATGLTAATWTSDVTLDALTTYFWRVRAGNACGEGANSATFSFTTEQAPGTCPPGTVATSVYTYGFEAGLSGWASSGSGNTWAITTTAAYVHSGTQAMHANDPATTSDQRLVSPSIVLPTGQDPLVLEFWNFQTLQADGATACFDGGILEISTNGGSTWSQVPDVDMLTDPYDGPIGAGNPLAGLEAWCGDPQAYLNSIVDVSTWAGMTVKFRFRLGSNGSTGRTNGWNLDDVLLQSCTSADMPFLDGFETGDTSRWSAAVP